MARPSVAGPHYGYDTVMKYSRFRLVRLADVPLTQALGLKLVPIAA